MQKLYRLSAAILIVSLVLLSAPPARAGHVIDAVFGAGIFFPGTGALTNTGEVYHSNDVVTWTLIATVPGAFGFSIFDFDGTGDKAWLFTVQGTNLFRSLVSGSPSPSIGPPLLFGNVCPGSPIRSFVLTAGILPESPDVMTVHEDGTLCFNGIPFTGPPEPVAVEERTWGGVKDKFKD